MENQENDSMLSMASLVEDILDHHINQPVSNMHSLKKRLKSMESLFLSRNTMLGRIPQLWYNIFKQVDTFTLSSLDTYFLKNLTHLHIQFCYPDENSYKIHFFFNEGVTLSNQELYKEFSLEPGDKHKPLNFDGIPFENIMKAPFHQPTFFQWYEQNSTPDNAIGEMIWAELYLHPMQYYSVSQISDDNDSDSSSEDSSSDD